MMQLYVPGPTANSTKISISCSEEKIIVPTKAPKLPIIVRIHLTNSPINEFYDRNKLSGHTESGEVKNNGN